MSELFTLQAVSALVTLAALEIILGIDNVVFIAILTGKLPKHQQAKGRKIGLIIAALGRIVLLFFIAWLVTLDETKIYTWGDGENEYLSLKGLILILGGLFLLGKATWEIHENLEGHAERHADKTPDKVSFSAVIGQVLMLDLVFSIDSVLTAVGIVNPADYTSAAVPGTSLPWVPVVIMSTAIILAIAIMLSFAGPLSQFISNHPTMKMLALCFLLLIGVVLVAEGLHVHIPRGYIYFAMGFSLLVEVLNLKFVKKGKPSLRATTEGHG